MRPNSRLATFSTLLVTLLTVGSKVAPNPAFFYSLWPGAILSLRITGGHGGTEFQEAAAGVLGFLANVAAYFCVLLVAGKLVLRRKKKTGPARIRQHIVLFPGIGCVAGFRSSISAISRS